METKMFPLVISLAAVLILQIAQGVTGAGVGHARQLEPAVTCTQAGFFAFPDDCYRFYRCVDYFGTGQEFTAFVFDCPAGTVFDESLSICNHPDWIYPARNCRGGGSEATTVSSGGAVVVTSSTASATAPPTTQPPATSPPSATGSPATVLVTTAETAASTEAPATNAPSTGYTGAVAPTVATPEVPTSAPETTPTVPTPTSPPETIPIVPIVATDAPTAPPTIDSTPIPTTAPTVVPDTTPTTPLATTDVLTTFTAASTAPTAASTDAPPAVPVVPVVPVSPFVLTCGTDGFQRHPLQCNIYYQCLWTGVFQINITSCPDGQYFDERTSSCLPPDQTTPCSQDLITATTTTTVAPPITTTTASVPAPISPQYTVAPGSMYNCPTVGNFPYELDCIRFYRCFEVRPGALKGLLYRCPAGYVFNVRTQRCQKQDVTELCDRSNIYRVGSIPIPVMPLEDTPTTYRVEDFDN